MVKFQRCMMAAMDEKNTIWIKHEEVDDMPTDPHSMSVEDPMGLSCPTDFIKQEPEVISKVDDTETVFVEDPLRNSYSTDFINQEPEVILKVEDTENIVALSTGSESDSTRERQQLTSDDVNRILDELEEEEVEGKGHEEFLKDDVSDDPDYESEVIEDDIHQSDSEIDLENEGENDIDQQGLPANDIRFYIGKDMETIWASLPNITSSKTKSKNISKTLPGPRGQARQCETRLGIFQCIITPEMVESIVRYTNIYIERKKLARQALAEGSSNSEVRDRDYKPTTTAEMLALFGALFLIAVKRGNCANFSEYFNSNGTGLTILRANFSLNRFRFLLRAIRFDDLNTRLERQATDKLAPIREILSSFIANSQKSFSLGEYVTVDEMLVAFRGRCSFIQYMSQKPAKYGLKMYALCDARTFYTHNLEVYCGKQVPGRNVLSNKPYDVVARLVACIERTNRNVTTDNYFSSYPLAEYLLSKGLTFLGTMRKNKKEIPPEFVTVNRNAVAGDYMFGCQDDKSLISMITKKRKAVVVLSTMHDTDIIDEDTKKPAQITDYNSTKGGVDTVDLKCSRISTSTRTQRWPVCIFFRLLDLAGINSLRISQFNTGNVKETTRRQFLHELALELMTENLKERAKLNHLPKDLLVFLKKYRESDLVYPAVPTPTRRGICYLCGSKKNIKTKRECGECGRNVCIHHSTTTVRCNNCCQPHNKNEMDTD